MVYIRLCFVEERNNLRHKMFNKALLPLDNVPRKAMKLDELSDNVGLENIFQEYNFFV